ncbi:C3 and PZP-like alpha-2-macroglobulin domain-containing protein 8 isoform X2 [Apis dorsata]|uniref:C3 and PZP-like alpha-2-macroglobulin domain-containing protein 8 isoform X2 n=1 Tax=Apis mellifera TaxID=7460 RepID=A0A7M7FZ84_APIME|nr:C3 and PZP-like alpha-2-macroglobulin domain-containing protein 8 isoform X2 [Apis mellifera]XP_006623744.1 C3 and PZP-like alpha-2-macroglobulin domain-containing protein 8 isoform X2 [Apis dorsata]XP_016910199.1 C3 and PZP-like alpha-2-macroglobulin domain-containing protein 8 isoform X2 [Apis cerana]|eukprot:XP_001120831.2 C3 and PZP-like alpha-2-macroglobulin domain-containing protein 8 isoform X2 [Apis mellifera]
MSFIRIITPDSSEYRYFPITKSRLRLCVQAAHDARISLRTHLGGDSNVYEIIIGGWGNTMSAIKRNNQEQDVAEAETQNILGAHHMCNIWIQWFCDGTVNVGHLNGEVFLSYKDRNPFVINYIGVSTAWGATGEFLIEESPCTSIVVRQQLIETSHFWVDYNESSGIPQNAVMASEDGLYIGRTHHRDSLTPGGIRNNVCTIAWGGASHDKKDFQILCGRDVNWVKSWEGSVPLYALPAGESEDDYALFIGRVLHEGVYHIGKIQPNHQVCYIPVDGHEEPYIDYETLVICDYYAAEYIGR